jgi:hypothetical protein
MGRTIGIVLVQFEVNCSNYNYLSNDCHSLLFEITLNSDHYNETEQNSKTTAFLTEQFLCLLFQ